MITSPLQAKKVSATFALTLRIESPKANGTFPVRLRVTFLRQRKYYGIGIDMTSELFADTQNKEKRSKEVREARARLAPFESKAKRVIEEMVNEPFSFQEFEKRYFQNDIEAQRKRILQSDVYNQFTIYIASLQAEGRVATALSYQTACNSFKVFKKELKFDQVTPELLNKYEQWMLSNANSISTIGIYTRSLRTIINQAKLKGIIKPEQYPFGRGKYIIPASRNIKKALSLEEIKRIFQYEAVLYSAEDKARDFWCFSYLTNGLNLKDIARLKWKNIDGNKLVFIRSKTSRTSKADQKPIAAILSDKATNIIEKWGTADRRPEAYVFGIYQEGISPVRERELVQNFTRTVNKWMGRIALSIGINKKVTTYFARHSYATVLKRSGVPLGYISESLGHKDLRTTESYLDSFEDSVKQEYAKALLNF